jgi:3-methyladenine DNA glycosylase Mpg
MLSSRLGSEKRLTVAERLYIDQQADRLWRELITDDNENVDTEYVRNAY